MTPLQFAQLLFLAAVWGASFLFMKVGSPELGPIVFTVLRTGIASLFLIMCLLWKKQKVNINGYKAKIFILGALNTAIPFVLFSYATLTLSAGTTSVLNATVPMFGALIAYLWLKDKMSPATILGLLIGFLGVYLLMADQFSLDNSVILPALAAILASACYGFAANMTKRYLGGVKPLVLATGSQVSATIVLAPLCIWFMPTELPSANAIYSAFAIGIVCTGIAYIMFFALLRDIGTAKTMSVTYLIPAFGLVWGAVFLGEQITLDMLINCLIILFGVAMTTGLFKLPKIVKRLFSTNNK